jgi:Septum formation
MSRARRTSAALVVVALGLVSGCSSSGKSDSSADSAEKSPEVAVSSAPPPPAAPKVGSCHHLSLSEATEPVDAGKPVPCSRPHTSVTSKVGRLSLVVDGHLLAIDSRTVRRRIADACPDSAGAFVGGDRTTQQLSRFEVVWFSPSLKDADAGADWYRCDVVAPRSAGKLLNLPPRLKGVLAREGALDRFGTCGTAAPDARGFSRVVCSEKHKWRAVATRALPADRPYLAKDVTAAADSWCKDVASERADGSLQFTWSFEWPPRAQWKAGQRYGYCWVPEA